VHFLSLNQSGLTYYFTYPLSIHPDWRWQGSIAVGNLHLASASLRDVRGFRYVK
jgi:hypothetical protein